MAAVGRAAAAAEQGAVFDGPEKIRLVVWDLDETFWKGTLTEGGIEYVQANHDLVIELARRGIMSSIVSKNDHEVVKAILVEKGLWDYFIFPSIDWNPKGPRLAQLVENVQLRAPTILFIDDNHLNLREAQHFVDGLQVADETVIPQLSAHPLFKGKDDAGLTRLAQYKLLERRKEEEAQAGPDNTEFLRSCDIRVVLDTDVEANIDRAVELINRTNQLNFTKKRLSDDPKTAAEELRSLIGRHNVAAGLIRVVDRYGDYGFVGFYAMNLTREGGRMIHYCFSCRILNMGVESWLYRHLGEPILNVQGEVLTDLFAAPLVDWIKAQYKGEDGEAAEAKAPDLDHVYSRGGCDMQAIIHYFDKSAGRLVEEYDTFRHGSGYRTDHSVFLRYALDGVPAEAMASFKKLGYVESDFHTRLGQGDVARSAAVFSFTIDSQLDLYRHRETGLTIAGPALPAKLNQILGLRGKAAYYDLEALSPAAKAHAEDIGLLPILRHLQAEYDLAGPIDGAAFKANVARILEAASGYRRTFIICPPEKITEEETGKVKTVALHVRLNGWIREVAARFPNAATINVEDCDPEPLHHAKHFRRTTYFNIYKAIQDGLQKA